MEPVESGLVDVDRHDLGRRNLQPLDHGACGPDVAARVRHGQLVLIVHRARPPCPSHLVKAVKPILSQRDRLGERPGGCDDLALEGGVRQAVAAVAAACTPTGSAAIGQALVDSVVLAVGILNALAAEARVPKPFLWSDRRLRAWVRNSGGRQVVEGAKVESRETTDLRTAFNKLAITNRKEYNRLVSEAGGNVKAAEDAYVNARLTTGAKPAASTAPTTPAATGKFTATAGGVTYFFPTQKQADDFKKAAGVQ